MYKFNTMVFENWKQVEQKNDFSNGDTAIIYNSINEEFPEAIDENGNELSIIFVMNEGKWERIIV